MGSQQREGDRELRAVVDLAGHGDRAAMLLDNPARDREPEAGAICLGGEEWFEETPQILGRNADAIVLDRNLQCRRSETGGSIRSANLRRNLQRAIGSHGVQRVKEQVDERLFQLVVVTANGVWRRFETAFEFDFSPFQMVLNQIQRLLQNLMDVDGSQFRPGRTAEAKHLADDGIDPVHLAIDDLGELRVLILADEEIDEGLDGDERILHLVRHAGGQGADAGETIHPAQVLFELPGRGEILDDCRDALGAAGVVQNGRHLDLDRSTLSGTGSGGDLQLAARLGASETVAEQFLKR